MVARVRADPKLERARKRRGRLTHILIVEFSSYREADALK